MRTSWRASCWIACATLAIGAASAYAATDVLTWNTAAGDWTNPANWSAGNLYPNNSGGNTFEAVIDSPGATVNLNAPIVIEQLTLTPNTGFSGQLGGNGFLQTQIVHWGNGIIFGSGQIQISDSMTIDGQFHGFGGFSITNGFASTTTWVSGDITSVNSEGGHFTNFGTFIDQSNAGWTWGSTNTPVFDNMGIYIKSAGADESIKRIYAAFNNSGQVDVQTSDLWFYGGGMNTGSYTVASGARLFFSDLNENFSFGGAPITNFGSLASITSDGTVIFANNEGSSHTIFQGSAYESANTVIDAGPSGLVQFTGGVFNNSTNGNLYVRSGTFELRPDVGGTQFQTGELTATSISSLGVFISNISNEFSDFSWSAGHTIGDGTTPVPLIVDHTLAISGFFPKSMTNRSLVALGTTTMEDANLSLDSSFFTIGGAGSFTILNPLQLIDVNPVVSPSRFINAGKLFALADTGSVNFAALRFDNSGTATVQSGKLRLGGGGDSTGRFILNADTTLELGSGSSSIATHILRPASRVTGPASSTLRIVGANLDAQGSISVGAVQIDGATVNYTSGSFSGGAMQLSNGGNLLLSQGNNKTLRAISVNVDSLSKLDLTDNSMIVDYDDLGPSPIDSIRQQILAGYHQGDWTGHGITTSLGNATHGLGYNDIAGTILVKYALFGDTDLNGLLNDADLDAIDLHWEQPFFWSGGDSNYDGFVNIADLYLLAPNWPTGIDSLNQELEARGLPQVPEPGAISLLIAAGTLALKCQDRSSRARHRSRRA